MIKETVYTGIGAAALAVEFVTDPTRQQGWLKKAERKGGKLAQQGELRLRKVTKEVESLLGEARSNGLKLVRSGEAEVKQARATARRGVARTRATAPKARVTSRTGRTGARRRKTTTLSVVRKAG